jgi:predicted AlkP superfamily pyrophosphatase or phosphodiesterase
MNTMKLLRDFTITFFLFLFALSLHAQDLTQHIVPGRLNNKKQEKKPYVILISADGFRYDLADKYHAENLIALRNKGVQAKYMIPAYPSLTFPNHYSIVTGLYPAHHGLVDNSFYNKNKNAFYSIGNQKAVRDSSWYGGVPLWALAEKNKMLSASFYWVGSEAAIDNVLPTYYYTYNDKIKIDDRLSAVKEWLQLPEDKRPHFITFYFPQVDHAEHMFGVDSKETEEAVHFIDESVAKMNAMVDSLHLEVNFIFVSDHGMANVDTLHPLSLPAVVDTSKFTIAGGDMLLHLYAKDSNDIVPTYKQLKAAAKDFDVYLADSVPSKWHYSKADDKFDRIGDVLLVPHFPKVFHLSNGRLVRAAHGFDNYITEMRATFYAWGPAFKKHKTINGFENVNIYPMIAHILKLKYTNTIDGNLKVLKPILK